MSDNSLFGVHAAALEVRSQRMGLLASNIANASTPGFKAKDLDFGPTYSSGNPQTFGESAVFPGGIDPDKYWPPVARIDQAYGDRNLVCACPPPEAFAE